MRDLIKQENGGRALPLPIEIIRDLEWEAKQKVVGED